MKDQDLPHTTPGFGRERRGRLNTTANVDKGTWPCPSASSIFSRSNRPLQLAHRGAHAGRTHVRLRPGDRRPPRAHQRHPRQLYGSLGPPVAGTAATRPSCSASRGTTPPGSIPSPPRSRRGDSHHRRIRLLGRHEVPFDHRADIVCTAASPAVHPNGMMLHAFDATVPLRTRTYYSVAADSWWTRARPARAREGNPRPRSPILFAPGTTCSLGRQTGLSSAASCWRMRNAGAKPATRPAEIRKGLARDMVVMQSACKPGFRERACCPALR